MSVVLTTSKLKPKTEADELLFFVCIERRCGVHFIQFALESEKIRNPRVSWQGLSLGLNKKMKFLVRFSFSGNYEETEFYIF